MESPPFGVHAYCARNGKDVGTFTTIREPITNYYYCYLHWTKTNTPLSSWLRAQPARIPSSDDGTSVIQARLPSFLITKDCAPPISHVSFSNIGSLFSDQLTIH